MILLLRSTASSHLLVSDWHPQILTALSGFLPTAHFDYWLFHMRASNMVRVAWRIICYTNQTNWSLPNKMWA